MDQREDLRGLGDARAPRSARRGSPAAASPSSERAIATDWRWPPESRPDRRADVVQRADRERVQQRARVLLHRGLVEHVERAREPVEVLLAAEVEVGDDVEVVGQREVLVDGRDPEPVGVLR